MRYAGGDWLLFVDADSFPRRELFAEVAEAIEAGRCLAGGSTVAFERRDLVVRFWVALWNAMSRIMKWGAGSFLFCEAAAFRAAGGLTSSFTPRRKSIFATASSASRDGSAAAS